MGVPHAAVGSPVKKLYLACWLMPYYGFLYLADVVPVSVDVLRQAVLIVKRHIWNIRLISEPTLEASFALCCRYVSVFSAAAAAVATSAGSVVNTCLWFVPTVYYLLDLWRRS